ncbi:hypothetical protein GCM10027569_29820 [Flindersiella endophytica]
MELSQWLGSVFVGGLSQGLRFAFVGRGRWIGGGGGLCVGGPSKLKTLSHGGDRIVLRLARLCWGSGAAVRQHLDFGASAAHLRCLVGRQSLPLS